LRFCDFTAVECDKANTIITLLMKYYLLLLLLLTGCVSTQSLSVTERSRVYDLDYDRVFDATVLVLAEHGYAVIDAEKDEGIINTDYRAHDRLFSFLSGPTRRKISALISTTPIGTQVLLNLDIQELSDGSPISGILGGDSGNYTSKQVSPRQARRYYNELFENLENYLLLY